MPKCELSGTVVVAGEVVVVGLTDVVVVVGCTDVVVVVVWGTVVVVSDTVVVLSVTVVVVGGTVVEVSGVVVVVVTGAQSVWHPRHVFLTATCVGTSINGQSPVSGAGAFG